MIGLIIVGIVAIVISFYCWKQQQQISEYEFFIAWMLRDDIDMKDKMEWINNLKRSFRRK